MPLTRRGGQRWQASWWTAATTGEWGVSSKRIWVQEGLTMKRCHVRTCPLVPFVLKVKCIFWLPARAMNVRAEWNGMSKLDLDEILHSILQQVLGWQVTIPVVPTRTRLSHRQPDETKILLRVQRCCDWCCFNKEHGHLSTTKDHGASYDLSFAKWMNRIDPNESIVVLSKQQVARMWCGHRQLVSLIVDGSDRRYSSVDNFVRELVVDI